jgi:hypothetical protein
MPARGAIWRPKKVTFSKNEQREQDDPKQVHHAAHEQQDH